MAAVDNYSALISGYTWYQQDTIGKPSILTYSFNSAPPNYFVSQYPSAASSFSMLNDAEKGVVRAAIQQWSSVSGVQFIETDRHQGDLTFAFYNLNLTGGGNAAGQGGYPSSFAYTSGGQTRAYSGDTLSGGDVWFDTDYRASPSFASDFLHVALHEIGHALGLKHPFDTTSGHTETLTTEADKGANTVMSYDQSNRAGQLGPLDIAAAQYLYGLPSAKGTQFTSWGYDASTERFIAHGSTNSELLRGTGTDDLIYTEGGRDTVYTAQGNDVIVATGQSLDVNGGTGTDTVLTGLTLTSLSQIGGSSDFRYVSLNGVNQTYLGVERLVFTNDMIALDVQGTAGQVYRLYKAAFDRVPDIGGLSAHVRAVDSGVSISADAATFLSSPEFALRYGSAPTNEAFVTALYKNVLQRAPDAAGLSNWMTALTTNTLDRAGALAAFADSSENHIRVDSTIAAGIHLDYGAFV